MRLPNDLGDLTYCLNIHPAETWPEVREALLGPVREVRQAVAPDEPFAVGLRLSAQAMHTLEDWRVRAELKDILASEGYRVVTVNGFPYGTFHGVRVKEDVYQPDWRYAARLEYTCALAELMAELGAAGDRISLSTVPGTFKPLGPGNESLMADNLLKAAAHCAELERRTGVCVAIAIEPEPYCFLATIDESIAYFRHYLLSEGALRRFAELAGVSANHAAVVLSRHLGLCYDVCHAAVEFEDPCASIERLREAGIPIHKLQLSAALRVAEVDAQARHALEAFAEPTYLHQVVASGKQGITRYADLPEALARGRHADNEEWRIHYHVPIFAESLGAFGTTQPFLSEILELHRQSPICSHLEIETYTWHVLPQALKHERIEEAIACELRWVAERLA
ncbi:metabolite traffic protein EboE [Modicisalibacter luteus]|uniref:Metabolite traffic protein EboE n=1 Tax=Modicisalibacter luteus TaxID=453962 RepID=A0ABV7M4Q2_9GAMM|nr:metabolite traffic protein EboE [Halomonas lutea]GHA90110.1 sugar phosphate isomerase [Halomonas lutea]